MAIKKIKWKTLINQIDTASILATSDNYAEIGEIEASLNSKISEVYGDSFLYDLFDYIVNDVVTDSANGIWADVDVYTSSWRENDKRFIYLLSNKLREYLGFYHKILTDEGVQRHLVYAKSYGNDGSSSAIERGFNSNTPQNSMLYNAVEATADTNFDQAIADYASTIDKNKSKTTSHTEGTSDTTVSGTTWEEAKKNIQMMFFNELKDYIFSIPERILHYYSLETIPVPELFKKFIEHLEEVREIVENE